MPRGPDLSDYHRKRDPAATPEPFSATRPAGASRFVIHYHWARQRHYDLRLEVDGLLWSRAVPKGPAPDPAEKRLAVAVEPHPLDYAGFEGTIPEGNYGAGAMIIWDEGRWLPLIEPRAGFADGKLLFELRGHKLHGTWTLVRTQGGEGRQWLLIKERDGWVGRIPAPPMDSVRSGLTVEQLRGGQKPARKLAAAMRRAGAKPGSVALEPMLCRPGTPFTAEGWWFEIKYDGYRVLADRDGDGVRLLTRSGRDIAGNFPEVTEAVRGLPAGRFILDGELIVHDAEGLPDFSGLQQRGHLGRSADVVRAALARPATLYAFDLPGFDGLDLTPLPLRRRKPWLKSLLPSVGTLRYVDHIETRGEAAFEQAQSLRLEGLVAKRADSPYRPGQRAEDWIKLPALRTADFVVLGWVSAAGGTDFRALVVGQYSDGGLEGFGRVGSGLEADQRSRLLAALEGRVRPRPAARGVTGPWGTRWVAPEVVVEVRFKDYTRGGQLRQPVLLRVREDKPAADCLRLPERGALPEPEPVAAADPPPRVIESNRDKVFFPDGTTKGQVLDYYRAIGPWMLPWLVDRAIVMTRYPDGIAGKRFFQHEAPEFLPDWIRTEPLDHGEGRRKRHIVIDDLDSLLYVANLGTLPIHVYADRLGQAGRPDYCVLDLDPKEAPFTDVVAVARAARDLCRAAGLPCYPKTSGSTGLHLLMPLGGQCDHDQARALGEVLARILAARLPEIATIQRATERREGRVYLDYGQNGRGKTIAVAYCVREVPGAQVSMPLRWREVTRRLSLARHTVHSAPRRLRAMGEDPAMAALSETVDLAAVLARLADFGPG